MTSSPRRPSSRTAISCCRRAPAGAPTSTRNSSAPTRLNGRSCRRGRSSKSASDGAGFLERCSSDFGVCSPTWGVALHGFSNLQAELRRIAGHVQTFAAVGAALRLHQAKQQADPAVQAQLLAAVEAVLPGVLDGLNPQQISDALAYATFQIGDATDLFHNADRRPGWVLRDPTILQALGQASRQNVRSIVALATERPRLAASLAGRFLDVGTGVGAMALEVAEQ